MCVLLDVVMKIASKCDRKSILQLADLPLGLVFVRILPLGQKGVGGRKFQVSQVIIAIQLFVIFLLEVIVSFFLEIFFSLEFCDSRSVQGRFKALG